MRALIQRTSNAAVHIDRKKISEIARGILIFLGVGNGDSEKEINYLSEKICNLRIFEDAEGKMNLSLLDIKGSALIVSQFTLFADTKKGRRPSFIDAAPPDVARDLYKKFIQKMCDLGVNVAEGEFGAHMEVSLINDGPVTIWIDTHA